jgi:hypothetical protein
LSARAFSTTTRPLPDGALMTAEEFHEFWALNYPGGDPIGYQFRHRMPERWLRIHSLPESKRYAESVEEWTELLHRQNRVIDDLIGESAVVRIVINYIDIRNPLFDEYAFTNIGTFVDMAAETVFQSFLISTEWRTGSLNLILRMIANDEIRAFLIGPDCIVAPYDGGVDLILCDEAERDRWKLVYQPWLSRRDDGL